MRPFQIKDVKTREGAEAVKKIILKRQGVYTITTSEYETKFFEQTQHSRSLTNQKKGAFAKAYSLCKVAVIDFEKTDPNCYNEINEFHKKVCLNDTEDRYHIVIAWMKEVDYFVTADRELFSTRRKDIEKTLGDMYHILAKNNNHSMEVLNPIEFVKRFLRVIND